MSDDVPERVRLFVALELPDAARRALLKWRSGQTSVKDLRLTESDALHATLCFLGWRSQEEIGPIGAACAAALADHPAPELALGDALWLPPRRPRVLAVRIEDRARPLLEIQAALSDALSTGGWYRPEKRPYLAHVTVARVPARARVRAAELPPPPRLDFRPPAVTLYRSRLERSGARYEPLTRVELASSLG